MHSPEEGLGNAEMCMSKCVCFWEECKKHVQEHRECECVCVRENRSVHERLRKGGGVCPWYVWPYNPLLTSSRCQTDGPPLPCQGSGPESYAPAAFSPPGRLLGG